MENQEQDIVERLKKANNILLTVSNNPSVDQLAACIGLTIALNKLDKHATAVFSGEVPSTIEFLQPEETLEKNTDSLRDFIISLDKSKADKLRYKVEDRVVRIFITPYKTSISDQDLEFSQGDFNVDVVLAIGVQQQNDLDQAITAHGRIMHDATVITVNNRNVADLGSINWLNTDASSLSEMATTLTGMFNVVDLMDQQIATALLTGIVAETERFSNDKTTANTMNSSAALMAAGANQQLVAQKLQEPMRTKAPVDQPVTPGEDGPGEPDKLAEVQIAEDGTLEIDHKFTADEAEAKTDEPKIELEPQKLDIDRQTSDEPKPKDEPEPPHEEPKAPSENYDNPRTAISTSPVTNQPAFTSAIEPNKEEQLAQYANPLNLPPIDPQPPLPPIAPPTLPSAEPIVSPLPTPTPAVTPTPVPDHTKDTLEDLEQEVKSAHLEGPTPTPTTPANPLEELDLGQLQRPSGLDEAPTPDVDAARDAVAEAMSGQGPAESPTALNSNIMVDNLHPIDTTTAELPVASPPLDPNMPPMPGLDVPPDQAMTMPLPPFPGQQTQSPPQIDSNQPGPNDPPAVPPPITFPR